MLLIFNVVGFKISVIILCSGGRKTVCRHKKMPIFVRKRALFCAGLSCFVGNVFDVKRLLVFFTWIDVASRDACVPFFLLPSARNLTNLIQIFQKFVC